MIEFIEIKGYKSIKNMRLELQPINILIGSNGAGKSNFISFFKLIKALYNQQLRRLVIEEGVGYRVSIDDDENDYQAWRSFSGGIVDPKYH